MSSSTSSSSSASSDLSEDSSEVSVMGYFQVGPSVFDELGNELMGGRGACYGTVFERRSWQLLVAIRSFVHSFGTL